MSYHVSAKAALITLLSVATGSACSQPHLQVRVIGLRSAICTAALTKACFLCAQDNATPGFTRTLRQTQDEAQLAGSNFTHQSVLTSYLTNDELVCQLRQQCVSKLPLPGSRCWNMQNTQGVCTGNIHARVCQSLWTHGAHVFDWEKQTAQRTVGP